jgi:hypothetical protein
MGHFRSSSAPSKYPSTITLRTNSLCILPTHHIYVFRTVKSQISINKFVFAMGTQCVFCAVRTEFLHPNYINSRVQRVATQEYLTSTSTQINEHRTITQLKVMAPVCNTQYSNTASITCSPQPPSTSRAPATGMLWEHNRLTVQSVRPARLRNITLFWNAMPCILVTPYSSQDESAVWTSQAQHYWSCHVFGWFSTGTSVITPDVSRCLLQSFNALAGKNPSIATRQLSSPFQFTDNPIIPVKLSVQQAAKGP